jgi:hypothetical protein
MLFKTNNYHLQILNGTHTESYWRGEFAAAYLWLFQNETLTTNSFINNKVTIFKTNNNQLFVEGLDAAQEVFIYSIEGKLVDKMSLYNGYNTLNKEFQKGVYFIMNATLNKKIQL